LLLTKFKKFLMLQMMKLIHHHVSNSYRLAKKRRWIRTLLFRQGRSQKRGALWTYSSLSKLNGDIPFVRLMAPRIWSLSQQDERGRVLKFLSTYRQSVLNGSGGVIIDFSLVEKIFPNGGLLIWAELDRIRRMTKNQNRIRCRPAPKDSLADQVLKQIGVYECANHQSSTDAEDESIVHWRRASGVKAQGSQAEPMLTNFDGDLSEALKSSLYRGITEAMTNAVQHAYAGSRNDGTKAQGEKRWWLFSQQRDGVLNLVFCDLGIGIPRSLPIVHSAIKSALAKLGPSRADVGAIKIATTVGKTSTAAPNRGKGLPEILDAARKSDQGACVIYSNRGQFGFSPGGQVVENQFSNSIYGTLIDWRVPMMEAMANDVKVD
jgi:hypothetical protein